MLNLTDIQKGYSYRFKSSHRDAFYLAIGQKVILENIISMPKSKLFKFSIRGHTLLADSNGYGVDWFLED